MRNKEIEKRLNKVVSDSVPDVLDSILEKCKDKKVYDSVIDKKENKTRIKFPKKLISVFALIIICIVGVAGFNQYDNYLKVHTAIELDVNPSIEIQVNKKERVINVKAFNEDGKKILDGMDFKNADLDVTVNALIGSMLKHGYITDAANSILVSVKNNDSEESKRLREKLTTEIDELLKASSISGSILTQEYSDNKEIKKTAEENNMSEGKVKLINSILEKKVTDRNGKEFTFDTLAKMTINELNILLETKHTQVDDVKTTGTASKTEYLDIESVKDIAIRKVGVSIDLTSQMEVELDCDNGLMVYEVEFYVNSDSMKYEIEINAKTGEIIETDAEIED